MRIPGSSGSAAWHRGSGGAIRVAASVKVVQHCAKTVYVVWSGTRRSVQ
jgi:hypothetical protein